MHLQSTYGCWDRMKKAYLLFEDPTSLKFQVRREICQDFITEKMHSIDKIRKSIMQQSLTDRALKLL
jgi:hypothetical protein